ncbi:MAG TPA: hypothetical protein VE621_24590, partial [Bryobacteraceae bacterium]|nr:hypothetical protein [Bryobacteraceae bacterium]
MKLSNNENSQAARVIFRTLEFVSHNPKFLDTSSATLPATVEGEPRRRLSAIGSHVPASQLRPVVKHVPSTRWPEPWSLYWLAFTEMSNPDSRVSLRFIDATIEAVSSFGKLTAYTFFEHSFIHPHLTEFYVLKAPLLFPVPTLGIRPHRGEPRIPRYEDAKKLDPAATMRIVDQKKDLFRLDDLFPQMPVPIAWIKMNHQLARQHMLGFGGWSFALSTLDDQQFFRATKDLLTTEQSDEAIRATPFLVPLLNSDCFLRCPETTRRRYFELFDLYLAEDRQYGGLLIASKHCL